MTTSTKDTEKALTKTLQALHKMNNDLAEREAAKRWKAIDVPMSLKESLNRLPKSDLDSIRKKLEIKNASTLKKADLIEVLQENIPAHLERICKDLDKERYNLLTKVAENGGSIPAPSLEPAQFNYFETYGILFTGTFKDQKVVVMPQEIVEALLALDGSEIQSVIKRNTEWIKLTNGALYYYGSLRLAQLSDVLETHYNDQIRLAEYLDVIEQAVTYYKEIRLEKGVFSNARVFDAERVLREHKTRIELGYYPFTKAQLLAAGEPDFVDRNASYRKFVQFLLDHFKMTEVEADMIVEECVYAKRIGEQPKDILQYLQSRVEIENIETLRGIMDRIIDLMNNTRDWFLKGYTPSELQPENNKSIQSLQSQDKKIVDFHEKKKQKIGRNDPCPCGSNKKYKKCCGK
ncbi:SEC-C metal-binding domain-containing protein [Mesobacillus maritimus]|uniref:SEC-C domain-containing protein n=1 Tax=Mesobacillus maritimus TaxID=1643336 RepID=A0ABS7K6C3_9BACI|nr:SEC-C metal-binding domain-containing protein [Mesobacillus maritimus]MBY0097794.1 SEC-C domain-containing protein [Mesobacillus maritimus]